MKALNILTLLQKANPILFFTGKGGVGKTSTACATAIALADSGKRVLLVSTDPASNLDEVLGAKLKTDCAIPINSVPGLDALNIDPEAAAQEYRDRVVGPYREMLPEAAVASIEEKLSGACTVEIAAFDQFAMLLGDPETAAQYDHIIFDTAPTGHTLRLLELPAAWTSFIDANTTGASCLGPLSGLASEQKTYAAALEALRNPDRTQMLLVTRPEQVPLQEAARTAGELGELGINNLALVVNGVFTNSSESTDPIARALYQRGADALAQMPEQLKQPDRYAIPLLARAPMGIEGLRQILAQAGDSDDPQAAAKGVLGNVYNKDQSPRHIDAAPFDALLDRLEEAGHGVILTMGKGGVGKTTVAAAIAKSLSARGHNVHLTTTDPAAHVAEAARSGGSLTVSRIDPRQETERYKKHVMKDAGADLDDEGRLLLEEELRSPCTEEMAVFQAFARTVAGGESEFVVIDTAPTGHTLLLLDAAEAYHREVLRKPGDTPEAVRQLLPRLRNPQFARILLVTLPEATPVHEARKLESDLKRAGIEPFGWVINQALTGLEITHPVLLERQRNEAPYINEVLQVAQRFAILTWEA